MGMSMKIAQEKEVKTGSDTGGGIRPVTVKNPRQNRGL
jgi:hypothetical protein